MTVDGEEMSRRTAEGEPERKNLHEHANVASQRVFLLIHTLNLNSASFTLLLRLKTTLTLINHPLLSSF